MRHPITLVLTALVALSFAGPAMADDDSAPLVEVFKSPSCGCCTQWAEHLQANGFRVSMTNVADMNVVKRHEGVPAHALSCHTARVEGYIVEGHVPADDIRRLLRERPAVKGIAAPGMPVGSPGMESPNPEPYTVYSFDENGKRAVFSRHP